VIQARETTDASGAVVDGGRAAWAQTGAASSSETTAIRTTMRGPTFYLPPQARVAHAPGALASE